MQNCGEHVFKIKRLDDHESEMFSFYSASYTALYYEIGYETWIKEFPSTV